MTLKQPLQPTPWANALEKIYARQTRQNENELAQKIANEDEKLKVQQEESPLKVLEGLKNFSTSINALSKSLDAAKTKKEEGVLLANQLRFRRENPNQDLLKEGIEFRRNKNNLETDKTNLVERVKTAIAKKEISEEIGLAIINNHGSVILEAAQLLAYERLDNSIYNINKKLNSEGSGEFQTEFDKARRDGTVKEFYEKYLYTDLVNLNLPKPFFEQKLAKRIDKYTSTKGVLSSINYKETYVTAKSIEFDKHLTTALESQNAGEVSRLISNQIEEEGKDNVVLRITRLIKAREMGEAELEDILANLAKHRGGVELTPKMKKEDEEKDINDQKYANYEVGDKVGKLSLLFNKDDKEKIKRAFIDVAKEDFDNLKNTIENQIISARVNPNLSTTEKDNLISTAENNGLNDSNSAVLKSFRGISTTDNPRDRAAVIQSFSSYINGLSMGSMHHRKDEITKIGDAALNKQLNAIVEKETNYFNAVGLETTFKNQRTVIRKEAASFNKKKTLAIGETLDNKTEDMIKFMAKRRNWEHINILNANPDMSADQVYTLAEANFNKWREGLGWNNVGGNGILAPTRDGEFNNWKTHSTLQAQTAFRDQVIAADLKKNNDTINSKTLKQWREKVVTAEQKQGYQPNFNGRNWKENLLLTANSVTDPADIFRALTDPRGITYSNEIAVKARFLGIHPAELLYLQANALVNSNDPDIQSMIKDTGLKEKLPLLKAEKEKAINFRDAIVKSGHQDLLYVWEHIGLENASPAQLNRFIKYLEGDKNALQQSTREEQIPNAAVPNQGIIEETAKLNEERLQRISNLSNAETLNKRKNAAMKVRTASDRENKRDDPRFEAAFKKAKESFPSLKRSNMVWDETNNWWTIKRIPTN
mgnify:CR=1 FL=1